MERGCAEHQPQQIESSRHVLGGFSLPTFCGWVFDHSRAPDRLIGLLTRRRLPFADR